MSLRKSTDLSRRSRMDLGLGINVGTAGDTASCARVAGASKRSN